MKQNISPVAFFTVILVALAIAGAVAFSVWKAPSSTVDKAAASASASPRAGGGPTAEDFRKRDEYNKTHPGAVGSH